MAYYSKPLRDAPSVIKWMIASMRRTLLIPLAVAAAIGLLTFRTRAWQRDTAASGQVSTFLIMLGLNSTSVERWDGSASVSGGALAALEGWHFSAGDSASAAGWRCSTLRDEVAPYADVHYTEMRPGSRPAVLFHPVGVFLTLRPEGAARVAVQTTQGNFEFAAAEIGPEPKPFLSGRASVARVPSADKHTDGQYEDEEPAIAVTADGAAVAWVAYRNRADRVLMRRFAGGAWSAAEEISPKPAEIFRVALAGDWAFWSQRDGDAWQIWGRRKSGTAWQPATQITRTGSNTFLRAAASPQGSVVLAWSSFRGGQSDIYLRAFDGRDWRDEMRVSESPANDWEPAIAAAPDGSAYIAWDSYDRGNYDIFFREFRNGQLGAVVPVTTSPKFQAHASVAVDRDGRPWVAWNESGVNWGKDQGFLIPTPMATPLHQQRAVRLARWDGKTWLEPRARPVAAWPEAMRQNGEHPQIVFDGAGALNVVFRHWTRRNARTIGSPMMWENYLTRFDGQAWSTPEPLPHSAGSIEKHAALARDSAGDLWAAWMTDGRSFATARPENGDIWCGRLGRGASSQQALEPLREAFVEELPVHVREPQDVRNLRSYTISAGGKMYHIWRGDMHRHTDFSQDFKYDGSLLEVYRYALDAAAFDYIAPTDHQAGFDQEFTWWQNQKLVDLFFMPGSFAPLYAYERSVPYPNGHRNIIFAHPGVRTLPIPPEEQQGRVGAGRLYEYLRQNRGISMPHSSATDQGTDWRDNNRELEPLVEIYQGYRNSYEYEGAPRSATELNPQAQKSGWQPAGFWWNALAKGYKLGVQASSDHWSTHISYACIVSEQLTRDGLLDAIRKRHAYGATDNIIVDFRARDGSSEYIMGDAFSASAIPRFTVHIVGSGTIRQIDLVKNRSFVYTTRPGGREAAFEFTDKEFGQGESWYYVRIQQDDGQLAWSSPIWATRR